MSIIFHRPIIFPPEIEFVFPDDIGAFTCRLAWQRSEADGTSRDGFRWPPPGEWTPTVEADTSRKVWTFGLHAAKKWCGAFAFPLFQIVAIPIDAIAREFRHEIRFSRAAVIAHPDVVGMIRAGKFAGADMEGADLSWLDLTGADFTGTDLSFATLIGTNLIGANFTGANLYEADFAVANLTDAVGLP